MIDLLEWLAFGIGTVGTLCWATGFRLRGAPVEGWLWLLSALLWIWFAWLNHHGALVARDALGVMLYTAGIFKSFRPDRHHEKR